MAFEAILKRFMEASPIPVMARSLITRVFSDKKLNNYFEQATEKQYTRDLLFDSLFKLMSLVVTRTFPSVHAAYQVNKEDIGVSVTAVYDKLNGLETSVSAALVQQTALDMETMIEQMNAGCQPLLPGYRVKMLDGNCIEASEHRLSVLRDQGAAPLPGKSLVVYDPSLEMAIDVFPCEDGHAQERSLLSSVIQTVQKNDVWIADRNFCVRSFLIAIRAQQGYFVIRHHKQMLYEAINDPEKVGESDTGDVYEQWITLQDEHGQAIRLRRITVKLKKKTRNGDPELILLTNLPKNKASASVISHLYRKRWTIETMFQQLESYLHSEINTLGYPKAALFGFCVALVAYNIMAVIKAAMRHVHGEEKIEREVSGYYIAGEIGRTHEGMSVAVPAETWEVFIDMSDDEFAEQLITLAGNIQLDKYKKNRRGEKKPAPKRAFSKKNPHVSTAQLLKSNKKSP